MVKPEIKFGDKLFFPNIYEQDIEIFGEYEQNSVVAENGSLVHGYVVEILSIDSLASLAPFIDGDMIDVTDRLSIQVPLLSGTKVWMPVYHSTNSILLG